MCYVVYIIYGAISATPLFIYSKTCALTVCVIEHMDAYYCSVLGIHASPPSQYQGELSCEIYQMDVVTSHGIKCQTSGLVHEFYLMHFCTNVLSGIWRNGWAYLKRNKSISIVYFYFMSTENVFFHYHVFKRIQTIYAIPRKIGQLNIFTNEDYNLFLIVSKYYWFIYVAIGIVYLFIY